MIALKKTKAHHLIFMALAAVISLPVAIKAEECNDFLYQEFHRTDCKELADENYIVDLEHKDKKIAQINQDRIGTCYACSAKVQLEHFLKEKAVITADQEIDLNSVIIGGNGGYLLEGGRTQNTLEQLRMAGEVVLKNPQTLSYEQTCMDRSGSGISPLATYLVEAKKISDSLQASSATLDPGVCQVESARIANKTKLPAEYIDLPAMVNALRTTKIHNPFSENNIYGVTEHKNPITEQLARCAFPKPVPSDKMVKLPPFNIVHNCYTAQSGDDAIKKGLLYPLTLGRPASISIGGHEVAITGHKKMLCTNSADKSNKIVELVNIRNSWGSACTGTFLAKPFYDIFKQYNCVTTIEDCIPGISCVPYVKSNMHWETMYSVAATNNFNGMNAFLATPDGDAKFITDTTVAQMLSSAIGKHQTAMAKYSAQTLASNRPPWEILSGPHGLTPVLSAVRNNYFDIVIDLLATPNVAGSFQYLEKSILYNIAVENNLELEKNFVQFGKQICNLELLDGSTPLLLAIASENPQTLEIVLKYCDPSFVSNFHQGLVPPALFAAYLGYSDSVKKIISFANPKLDLNKRDLSGNTLLMAAIQGNNKELVQYLLSIPEVVQNQLNSANLAGATPLSLASNKYDMSILDLLLQYGASMNNSSNVDAQGNTPLHLALTQGLFGSSRKLLQIPGVTPEILTTSMNKAGKSPLQIILESNKSKAITTMAKEFLKDPNVYVKKEGEVGEATLLYWALETNNRELVKNLLAMESIDPNFGLKSGQTPLELAEARNDAEMVSLIMAKITAKAAAKTVATKQ
ncbi:MAG: ankyrin repeat domain-containing protein [Oligoflexia bacterium]|nr:ankyrin repeat domain-containing protein [Oligoflexia bacterium]